MLAQKSPQMMKAVGVLKELSADEQERMLYEAREMARMDEEARLNDAVRNIVRNPLDLDTPIEIVVKATGLTHEEIKSLQLST